MFLIAFGIFGYSGFQTQPCVVVIKVLSKDLRLSSLLKSTGKKHHFGGYPIFRQIQLRLPTHKAGWNGPVAQWPRLALPCQSS